MPEEAGVVSRVQTSEAVEATARGLDSVNLHFLLPSPPAQWGQERKEIQQNGRMLDLNLTLSITALMYMS